MGTITRLEGLGTQGTAEAGRLRAVLELGIPLSTVSHNVREQIKGGAFVQVSNAQNEKAIGSDAPIIALPMARLHEVATRMARGEIPNKEDGALARSLLEDPNISDATEKIAEAVLEQLGHSAQIVRFPGTPKTPSARRRR